MLKPDDHTEHEDEDEDDVELRIVQDVTADGGETDFGDQNGLIEGTVYRGMDEGTSRYAVMCLVTTRGTARSKSMRRS